MTSKEVALALKLQEAEREAAFVRLLQAYRALQPQLVLLGGTAGNFEYVSGYMVGDPNVVKPNLPLKEKVVNIRASMVEAIELLDLLLRYYDEYHARMVEGALLQDKVP